MSRKVFLSCVTREFLSYRELLAKDLRVPGVEVRVQEDFIGSGHSILDKLDTYIKDCDAVIHLVGSGTGCLVDRAEVNALLEQYPQLLERVPCLQGVTAETLSYTQWEAWLAIYHRIPCYLYQPEPSARRGPEFVEDAGQKQLQEAHWQRLLSLRKDPATFRDEQHLCRLVLRSLNRILPGVVKKPQHLPYPSLGTLFKGRDEFLQQLRASLRRTLDGNATAIVGKAVHGLGGVGKTRLAVEYAWQHHDDYTALLFVGADSPANLRQNLAALVGPLVLDLPEQDAREEEAKLAAALRWLHEHPGWFLILDNVDSEEAAQETEQLLARLHGGHVLITSRLARWSCAVEPLELDVLRPEDAARFLLERTERGRRRQPPDEADARLLANELGGLALALEQAGAYIQRRRIALADYLAAWRGHVPAVQEWHDPRVMQYPRSLAVTWQTTIDQLRPGELALLRLLAWFAPDPLPLFVLEGDQAAAIWREASDFCRIDFQSVQDGETSRSADALEIADALATLGDFSMVRWDAAGQTVTVHRVVQEILRTRLPAANRRAWLSLSLRLLNKAAPFEADDVRTWPRWNPLRPHVGACVAHADEAGITEPTARLISELGNFLYSKALHGEAESLMRRALAIDEQAYGAEHADVARDLNNLALLLQDTSRLAEAEPLMRRALAIDEQVCGAEHPNVARDLNNLAQLLKATRRLAEAEPLMRRALAIDEQTYGAEHTNVATDLNNLALLLRATKRQAQAEPLLRRALAIDEQVCGAEHPNVARDLNNLALLLRATRRLAEAEPLMRRALAIDEQAYGAEHPRVASELNNLASLLQDTRRLAVAEPLMRRALAIQEQAYGAEHPGVAIHLNNLAQLLKATRRLAEAEPLMRRCLAITKGFREATGNIHPNAQTFLENYRGLLEGLEMSVAEIAERLREAMR